MEREYIENAYLEVFDLYYAGEYTQAINLLIQIANIANKQYGETDKLTIDSMSLLAEVYRKVGNYEDSLFLNHHTLAQRIKVFGENNKGVATNYNNLGATYLETGDYENAIYYYSKCLSLDIELNGKNSRETAISLNNLGNAFKLQGNYVKSKDYFILAVEIWTEVNGNDDIETAYGLSNLSEVEIILGYITKGQNRLKEALEIFKTQLGETHIEYLSTFMKWIEYEISDVGNDSQKLLNDLLNVDFIVSQHYKQHRLNYHINICIASCYLKMDDFDNAELFANKSLLFINEKFLKYKSQYTTIQLLLFDIFYLKNDFNQAKNIILKIDIDKQDFDSYKRYLKNKLLIAIQTKDLVIFEDSIVNLEIILNLEIIDKFYNLPKNQREVTFRKWTGLYNIVLTGLLEFNSKDLKIKEFFRFILKCKNYLNQTEEFFYKSIKNSADKETIELFDSFLKTKKYIYDNSFPNPSTFYDESSPIDIELVKVYDEKEVLEERLLNKVDFSSIFELNLDSIFEGLSKNLIYLEFFSFYNLNFDLFSDVVKKFALTDSNLILNGYSGNPITGPVIGYTVCFIYDPNLNNFILIDIGKSDDILPIIYNYFRINAISSANNQFTKLEINQSREEIMSNIKKLIYEPLVPYLINKNEIIVTPDGLLKELPFEIVPISDTKYMIDDYIFSYQNSIYDLKNIRRYETFKNPPFISGCPDFTLINNDRPEISESLWHKLNYLGSMSDGKILSNYYFSELDNLLPEIRTIAEIYNIEEISNSNCNKQIIKNINSPIIFHIATHGFFNNISMTLILGEENIEAAAKHLGLIHLSPLTRCGLALSGANWRNLKINPPNYCENGIITADEIIDLNLQSTDLVVLSACETGLGDFQLGLGSQSFIKSFRMAGAKSIIASLWRIPDEQTKDIMIDFHKLVKSGEKVNVALREAQLKIKKKFSKYPKIWGGFVCYGSHEKIF